MAVTIRRPVGVAANDLCMRPPDPAVVVGFDPGAVCVEVLSSPNIFVVVFTIVT
jgi:hypothetical protein